LQISDFGPVCPQLQPIIFILDISNLKALSVHKCKTGKDDSLNNVTSGTFGLQL